MTEFGVAREIHVTAAKRIFDDMVRRSIERQVLAQRAKKIETLSPAAGAVLRKWMGQWDKSCRGLETHEIPDTDNEY